jgi:hypothetical protein
MEGESDLRVVGVVITVVSTLSGSVVLEFLEVVSQSHDDWYLVGWLVGWWSAEKRSVSVDISFDAKGREWKRRTFLKLWI